MDRATKNRYYTILYFLKYKIYLPEKCSGDFTRKPVQGIFLPNKALGITICIADLQQLQRQHITAAAKRKAVDDLNERPIKIICELVSSAENIANTSKLTIWPALDGVVKHLPISSREVYDVLKNLNVTRSKGEKYLLLNSNVW